MQSSVITQLTDFKRIKKEYAQKAVGKPAALFLIIFLFYLGFLI